ncbi:hypothetical protein GUJ93_ZPchr0002g23800 [Zizania palustris]|uniref:Uncharacterized protein n=1 Tax=Zizania palustris TaxID=103762 RepID=A0A8J5S5I9_ZIZPA|nr:hypothetical protein GUJ93_ZPchr0002g23800 [Zizania palustris]
MAMGEWFSRRGACRVGFWVDGKTGFGFVRRCRGICWFFFVALANDCGKVDQLLFVGCWFEFWRRLMFSVLLGNKMCFWSVELLYHKWLWTGSNQFVFAIWVIF